MGKWLVSRLICWRAPYFRSVAPMLISLEPGRCSASIRHRWRVQNHLGTVHAIALCNLAEFVGGLATDAAMTPQLRWIPKGMQVQYLRKAKGTLCASAELAEIGTIGNGAERIAQVTIRDASDEVVFSAAISMWVSNKVPR